MASVASKYRVSKWWIHQLKQRRAQTASIAAGQQGGHKPRAVKDSGLLTQLVSAHPDATLTELQERLKQQGINLKLTTLWYNLASAKLSFKKNRTRQRAGADRRSATA